MKLPAVGTWWKKKSGKWDTCVRITKSVAAEDPDDDGLGYVDYEPLSGWAEAGSGNLKSFLDHYVLVKNPPPDIKAKMDSHSSSKTEADGGVKAYADAIDKVEKKLYSRMRSGKLKSKLGKKGKSKIPGFGYFFKRD